MVKRIICAVLVVWLVLSVAYSVAANVNEDFITEGGLIEKRLGLVVVQVSSIYENEFLGTCDRWGHYIDGNPGDVAVMVWNPFTTYFDDIVLRFDF